MTPSFHSFCNFNLNCTFGTSSLTFCILVAPECVIWQTMKTQMKCRIKPHFIRVYTVCQDKTIFTERNAMLSVKGNL